MAETAARLLALLSLLQRRVHWSGPELADRLGVTTRTIRRDVDRLRSLGYPVDADLGSAGGYQLGNGGDLPPLLLDDDEATAIAVALSVSTGGAVRGIEQPALAALAKLDRLLPPRLRQRAAAVRASTVTLAPPADDVDAELLVALAQACEGHERVTLTYRTRAGEVGERRVEPYRLVATGRRWYLLAFDLGRTDWRTFRVDRVEGAVRTGHRFEPQAAPDPATLVGEAITSAPYRHKAVVAVAAPVAAVRRRVPPTVAVVRSAGDGTVLTTGADDLDLLAGHLVALGLPFEVLEPPELRDLLHRLGGRLAADHRPG